MKNFVLYAAAVTAAMMITPAQARTGTQYGGYGSGGNSDVLRSLGNIFYEGANVAEEFEGLSWSLKSRNRDRNDYRHNDDYRDRVYRDNDHLPFNTTFRNDRNRRLDQDQVDQDRDFVPITFGQTSQPMGWNTGSQKFTPIVTFCFDNNGFVQDC